MAVATAVWSGAAPIAFGAPADRQQVQAQLLDHAEILCANCFFGASDYYYCFAADNKVLIGYQKTPVLNWEDKSKNYLTSIHHGWAAWTAPGQTVPISYDDKHIWVSRAEGNQVKQNLGAHVKAMALWFSRDHRKRVKLTRSSPSDIFTDNQRCRVGDSAKVH